MKPNLLTINPKVFAIGQGGVGGNAIWEIETAREMQLGVQLKVLPRSNLNGTGY
jgi:hypothetical protein